MKVKVLIVGLVALTGCNTLDLAQKYSNALVPKDEYADAYKQTSYYNADGNQIKEPITVQKTATIKYQLPSSSAPVVSTKPDEPTKTESNSDKLP